MPRCQFFNVLAPGCGRRMSISGADYYVRSTRGPCKIYWSCMGCDASAKSRFGFQVGAGEYELANSHEPGCPSQQQEADHNAGLEAEIDTNHNAGLEAEIEDPLEEEEAPHRCWKKL